MITASVPEVSRMLADDLRLQHEIQCGREPVKFVFFTDTHVQSVAPEGRHDVYFSSICAKLAWVYDYAGRNGCKFLVHGGDFINSVAQASNLRSHQAFVSSLLNESGLPTFINIGNHDYWGNMDMVFESPLGAYISSRALRPFTGVTLKFGDRDVILAGIPYSSPKETTSVFHKSCNEFLAHVHDLQHGDNPVTLLMFIHQLILDGKAEEIGVDLDFLADLRPTFVFNGHDHRNLGQFDVGELTFVQPGAVARYHNGTDEHTRAPSCALVTVHPDGNVEWRPVVIPHEPAEKVFFLAAKEVATTLEDVQESTRALASRVCVSGAGTARDTILKSIEKASEPAVWGLISKHAERLAGVKL